MIELIIFGLTPEVKLSPLIQKIQEPEIVLVETPPPEPTLEEKIASDYYKCEPTRYIRADTAECGGVRPEYRVTESRSTTERSDTPVATKNTARAPAGWYEWGWCTYGAWLLTGWAGSWGDAHSWDNNARADGYRVNSTPEVGSIFVDNGGALGHVGVVIAVNGNTITVKEMNYEGFGVWSTRTTLASNFVYIHRN